MDHDPDQGYPIRKGAFEPLGKIAGGLVQSRQQLTRTSSASAERLELAGTYTKLLLGCYRVGDANDPEVYTAAIVAVFSRYSEDVMRQVVDPIHGLPAKIQWLPTVREVGAACEKLHNYRDPIAEWDRRSEAQLEERRRIEAMRAQLPDKRETWEETKSDLQRRGFSCGEKPKVEESAEKVVAKYGISASQWDAIPDLPPDFELKGKAP